MRKIDAGNRHLDEYRRLMLYACMNGSVTITVGSAGKVLKGFTTLRKAVKAQVYKGARLKPRLSDVDFQLDGDVDISSGFEAASAADATAIDPHTLLMDLEAIALCVKFNPAVEQIAVTCRTTSSRANLS